MTPERALEIIGSAVGNAMVNTRLGSQSQLTAAFTVVCEIVKRAIEPEVESDELTPYQPPGSVLLDSQSTGG